MNAIAFLSRKCPIRLKNQKAMILPTTLVFMGVLVLLGTTAFVMSSTEMKIGRNHMVSEQAFYQAVAGCEEARARLADGAANPIADSFPTQMSWRAYIGDAPSAMDLGYCPADRRHHRYDSLAQSFGYVVEIRHASDGSGHSHHWGDENQDGCFERNTSIGKTIYRVTSVGSVLGSIRRVVTNIAEIPPIPVPGALYVEAASLIQGTSTRIIGLNGCTGLDTPGIVTPQGPGSVTVIGGAQVTGAGGSIPNISYHHTDMDVGGLVRFFAEHADLRYSVVGVTHSPTSVPGPGEGWGVPTPGATSQDSASCNSSVIIYYDTVGTYLKLSGGVQGCGILLVNGDLEIEGDFCWYGPIISTGSVIFTGWGDRKIFGAVISGGSAICGISGGNTHIVFRSAAVAAQTEGRPLQLLSWRADY